MKRFMRAVLRDALRKLLFDREAEAQRVLMAYPHNFGPIESQHVVCDVIDALVPALSQTDGASE